MMSSKTSVCVDYQKAQITSITNQSTEFVSGSAPLFTLLLREKSGKVHTLSAREAENVTLTEQGAVYSGFPLDIQITVSCTSEGEQTVWGFSAENSTDMAIERVDYPNLPLKPLVKNGGTGKLALPYNEGVLIEDAYARDTSPFNRKEVQYPSHGSFYMFPNMMLSQFMAYVSKEGGIYFGAHDIRRGPKYMDYLTKDDGIVLSFGTYTGCDFSENYALDFPIVTTVFDGGWEHAADIYRDWFENHLPENVSKLACRKNLPDWYKDCPLIVAYPVRGLFDTDEMTPNGFFPYTNILPELDSISQAIDGKVMALLMHWEGTAPWAPPYVWPPYGGEETFLTFRDKLHEKNHLLGVYCSGFGWTLHSNLVDYTCTLSEEDGTLAETMCTAPDGEVYISNICPAQRKGYDLCPTSERGKAIVQKAYAPLFASGIDYVQILDQNHGGGQYLCYSKTHSHPPVPGPWMTENMQSLLSDWNAKAPEMLFGCESAAAEPFIGNLLFSDNRWELGYYLGVPIPMYAYVYHEYVHNFMGNQVACPLDPETDTLCARLAYSFTAGDCMTVLMLPDGHFLPHWGCRDCTVYPDKEKALTFIKNLMRFYKEEAKSYLLYGRMEKPLPVDCECFCYNTENGKQKQIPKVFTSAWSHNGKTVQLLVNAADTVQACTVSGKKHEIKPLSAMLLSL